MSNCFFPFQIIKPNTKEKSKKHFELERMEIWIAKGQGWRIGLGWKGRNGTGQGCGAGVGNGLEKEGHREVGPWAIDRS